MNRHTLLSLRATGILFLGAVAALVRPAKSDAGDYLHQCFESNGAQIRYLEEGAGEPLVLLGDQAENWIEAGAFLLPYHKLVLDSRAGQSVSAAGEDVVRLLDHLHIPRAHVAGYSSGADVVAYLATVHPDRLLTATAGKIPQFPLAQPTAVTVLTAESGGSIPDPQFLRALAMFLRSHPARRKLWEPTPAIR